MKKQKNDFHLDAVFREKTDYVEDAFRVYRKVYDIPTIQYTGDVSDELYEYVLRRKYFVVLVLYDTDGKIFLERNIQERLYWSLPGGSISREEDMHSAVQRISARMFNEKGVSVSLGEVEPIAFVENEFRCNGESYVHHGIAFAARARNDQALKIQDPEGRFIKVTEAELKSINRYANREVVNIFQKRGRKFRSAPPENEISTNEKYKFRYLIHNAIVKRFILTPALKRKKDFFQIIKNMTDGASSYLDVSCGDNSMIFDLYNAQHFSYAVANDVSWSQLNTQHSGRKRIFFTNHNASHLPFRDDSFDAVLCANTLHHMESREELLGLLESCLRVGKKIIFVEVEKPQETGFFPHLLNKYWYTGFLKDVGGSYFSKENFQALMEDIYKGKGAVEFTEFKNIQGRYMVATITKKDNMSHATKKIEVEEKCVLSDKDALIERLIQGGFHEKNTVANEETDEYFTDTAGGFVKDRTCLRIRTREGAAELTFKGASRIASAQYAKVEHNADLSKTPIGDIKDILRSLGYARYVAVSKKRRTFSQSGESFEKNVSLDEVRGIGTFVEFEILADVSVWHEKTAELHDMVRGMKHELGADQYTEAHLPYRDYSAEYLAHHVLRKKGAKGFLFYIESIIGLKGVITREIISESKEAIGKIRNMGYKVGIVVLSGQQDMLINFLEGNVAEDVCDAIIYDSRHESDLHVFADEHAGKMGIRADECIVVRGTVHGGKNDADMKGLVCVREGAPSSAKFHNQYVFEDIMEIALILEHAS